MVTPKPNNKMDQPEETQPIQGGGGGPDNGPVSTTISGVRVEFPCRPYPSQMAMMSKVITSLKQRKNCLLESPTGSGKSLALLCSALAWQRQEAARVKLINDEMEERQLAAKLAQRIARREAALKKKQQQLESEEQKNRSELDTTTSEKQQGATDSSEVSFETSSSILTNDLTQDEEDDFKPAKRIRISASSFSSTMNKSGNDSMNADTTVNMQGKTDLNKKGARAQTATELETDTDTPYFVPPETKLTVPKIIFGTRTHKQIAQITRELRKTKYRNVRSIILASRDHTCIHPTVSKLSNKNEACRELVQKGGGCEFHARSRNFANFNSLTKAELQPAYDLEDLVTVGKKKAACPYYITRYLMQSADIIFCPYNYMVDPTIRNSMSMELDGNILIFDEAHNIEDASREASSFSIKQDELQRAMQDCEKVARGGGMEPYAHNEIAKFLSSLSRWMDRQSSQMKSKSFNSSGKSWNGTEFLGSTHAAGIMESGMKLKRGYFDAITLQTEEARERGLINENPAIAAQSVVTIEKVFKLFSELTRENGRYRNDFRVGMSQENVRQRETGNSGPMRSVQILSVHLWCLNPAVAFKEIQTIAHSIVLTSGTLSPMQSFESELGAAFPLKLEANHVIDKHQVWASVVGTGPKGVSLNGSYKNTETLDYQDELGEILFRICNTMPHGVLCFFPSYRLLDNLYQRWSETGILARIEKDKVVIKEPRSGPDMFQEAMDTFYDAIKESTKNSGRFTQTGALFLAVYRGKVSEGLDFADNNARAVVCIGIPFPNVKDMQVELKREYNTKNPSRGLLSGGEWYEIQAFRALNQALGRCIRHRKDWGAIFLVDDRYLQTPRYVNSLSKWIRSSVCTNYNQWSDCEASLEQFRDRMKALEFPHQADLSNCMESSKDDSTCVASGPPDYDGAHGESNEYLIGMKNKDPNWSRCSSGNQTMSVIPFANSFSSGFGNVIAIDSNIPRVHKLTTSKTTSIMDYFTSPSGDEKNEPNTNFVAPTTPGIISPRRSNRIASKFPNQRQKSDDDILQQQDKFNPSKVSVSRLPSTELNDGSSDDGKKRGREKNLKL